VRDWIERHPSLRWYVPVVLTAVFFMELWQVIR
jgi:hypothetical protein